MYELIMEPETWVAICFVIFVGLLGYFGLHRALVTALDKRGERIKAELDEAQRLKAEAQALLEEYQRKQREAEREAEGIIAGAKAEAERIAIEAKAKMEDFVAQRTKIAETKISHAEAQALSDVRAAVADAAVSAAEKILTQSTIGKAADDLISQGIVDVKTKLN